jgi:hypothetical protein
MYPNSDGVGLETVEPIGYEKFAFTDIGFPKIWVPAGYAKFGVCDVTGMARRAARGARGRERLEVDRAALRLHVDERDRPGGTAAWSAGTGST